MEVGESTTLIWAMSGRLPTLSAPISLTGVDCRNTSMKRSVLWNEFGVSALRSVGEIVENFVGGSAASYRVPRCCRAGSTPGARSPDCAER